MLVVDIASFNGVPDFKKLHSAGVRGVFIKATEGGTYVNPLLRDQWRAADRAGLIVGSYHFARQDLHSRLSPDERSGAEKLLPIGDGYMGVALGAHPLASPGPVAAEGSEQDAAAGATAEAEHFLRAMHSLPGHSRHGWRAGNFRPVLDFEVGTADHHYSPWRDAFAHHVAQHAKHNTILYTYSFFNAWRKPPRGWSQLWIADYSGASKPRLPAGYGSWHLWQFTSKAWLPGTHGAIDASRVPASSKSGETRRLNALRCKVDG